MVSFTDYIAAKILYFAVSVVKVYIVYDKVQTDY